MNNELKNMLSVCIFGKNCVSELKDCIRHATELTDKIFFVDLGSDDKSKSKAVELGARVVDLDSFTSTLQSEWVLFIKPDERPILRSDRDAYRMLSNQSFDGYAVMAQRYIESSALAHFEWVSSLGQYKNMKDHIYVPILEIRMVRRLHANKCLKMLVQNTTPQTFHLVSQAQDAIALNTINMEHEDTPTEDDDHDLRCMKGELTYEIEPHDALWELSKDYISFGVIHKGYLNSFMDGVKLGFGGDKMYLTMLSYLTKFGHFDEAKAFYETWIRHRSGKENLDLLTIGGLIYANLFLVDPAITCFQKAIELDQSANTLANLGKLYLVKGDKEKALFYLRKAVEKERDPLYDRIIEIVEKGNWKPSRLSLCMIAKDEEKTILRCLKSLEGIVDEIIVVDTGSSDKTREVVKDYGGKVIQTSWHDDFSAARNLALREATGDYILCMDADEFIEPRQRFSLAIFKAILPPERDLAFRVRVEAEEKEEEMSVMLRIPGWNKMLFQNRLFPNDPEIHFQGKAFEDIGESLKGLGIKVATDDIFKISHGISEAKQRATRKKRAILKSFHEIRNPEYFFEGALFFLGLGDFDQAYAWLKKSDLVEPRVAANIALLYLKENRLEQAKSIAEGSLNVWPEALDLLMTLVGILYAEEQFAQVVNLLKNRLGLIEDELERERAAETLFYYGMSCIETENLSEGIQSLSSAIEKDSLNTLYKMGGIYAFSKVEYWEEVVTLAGQILQEEGKRLDLLIKDFSDVGVLLIELYRHFIAQRKREEGELCLKIIEWIIQTKIHCNEDMEKISQMLKTQEEI